jgi:hypothetical protein
MSGAALGCHHPARDSNIPAIASGAATDTCAAHTNRITSVACGLNYAARDSNIPAIAVGAAADTCAGTISIKVGPSDNMPPFDGDVTAILGTHTADARTKKAACGH